MQTVTKTAALSKSQNGGVLLEFSVIVPVLLLICFGLFDIGQAFSQKAWLESVAYQSVMMGGELQEMRTASMDNVTNELVDILHTKLDKRFVKPELAAGSKEDEDERTVTSVVPGEMRMFSNVVKIPYQVSLTGPILVRDGDTSKERNPTAENDNDGDDDIYYDCFGNRITTDLNGTLCLEAENNGACNCACAGEGRGKDSRGCY